MASRTDAAGEGAIMPISLADLLGTFLTRPLGGPQFGSWLPKAASNATGGSPSGPTPPPISTDAAFLQLMVAAGLAGPQGEEARAKAEQARQQAALAKGLPGDID